MPYANKEDERRSKHDRYLELRKDPEYIAKQQKYRDEHRERVKEYNRIYRLENKRKIRELVKRRKHLWKSSAKKYQQEYGRQYFRKLREEVIHLYGGKCECCGDAHYEFLTIDHANGDGGDHRKLAHHTGSNFYKWLVKDSTPRKEFRLLCWNCNQATGRHGFCPHEIERKGDSKWHSQAQPEQSEQG